jgi:hypothetical protein
LRQEPSRREEERLIWRPMHPERAAQLHREKAMQAEQREQEQEQDARVIWRARIIDDGWGTQWVEVLEIETVAALRPPWEKMPELLNVTDLEQWLGIGEDAIRQALENGVLPLLPVGRFKRIPKVALMRWLGYEVLR